MDQPSPPSERPPDAPRNPLLRFLTEMDSKAARALWVSLLLFTAAGGILAFGVFFIDVNEGGVADALRAIRDAWWAPGAVTVVFTVLAFVGAPQVALIAATVAVFGPVEGAILSWLATMISAAVGFYAGRAAGAEALQRLGGSLMRRIARKVAENGFLAALIIRLAPSGPFIFVNLALGATGMRSAPFLSGSAVGILPKILLIAFAGLGISQLLANQTLLAAGLIAAAVAIWLAIVYVIRPRLRERDGLGSGD